MPSVRSLILLSILILVISLISAWLSLFQTPDSGGMSRNTYGTKGDGYRAVYDVLQELNIPVHRQLSPPKPCDPGTSLVFLQPDPRIVGTEPAYLHRLLPWVEKGGRLIVALPRHNPENAGQILETMTRAELPTLLEIVGLGSVEVELLFSTPADNRRRTTRRRLEDESILKDLTQAFETMRIPPREVEVHTTGSLASVSVNRLALAGDSVQTMKCRDIEPVGTISYISAGDEGDQEKILVAEFPRRKGSIVVVSDHAPFHNRLLAKGDNSVLAVHLCSPRGDAVVFDEFYHGLGVRGNPLYLMTRPGYAALLLGLLLFTCLSVWREAILLGPSLPDETVKRRDIGEYLTAMGRFFSQGTKSRPFLIQQIRAGVLRELSHKYALATEIQDVELIASVMSRRDPVAGERFRKTMTDIDKELQSRTHWTEPQTIDAMRRLTACLSMNA